MAPERDNWRRKNQYYYDELQSLLSFYIPPGRSILEIGCSTGDLLAGLKPAKGTGIDFSPEMIARAKEKFPARLFPNLDFVIDDAEKLQIKGVFDYVVLSDCIGEFTDIWKAFRNF